MGRVGVAAVLVTIVSFIVMKVDALIVVFDVMKVDAFIAIAFIYFVFFISVSGACRHVALWWTYSEHGRVRVAVGVTAVLVLLVALVLLDMALGVMKGLEFNAQGVANTLWARAEALAGTFNAQGVANTLWAYATRGGEPGAGVMKGLEGRAEAMAGTFSAQNVQNTLWAYWYAMMGQEPGAGVMRGLEVRAEAVAGPFNAQKVIAYSMAIAIAFTDVVFFIFHLLVSVSSCRRVACSSSRLLSAVLFGGASSVRA